MKDIYMSAEAGAGVLIKTLGVTKITGLLAALVGAAMMAVFRPPKNKREQILQATVALGCSFLFGDSLCLMLDSWFDWINLKTDTMADSIQFIATVHGLVGALAWGAFGGLAIIRDKLSKDPVQTIRDIKDL